MQDKLTDCMKKHVLSYYQASKDLNHRFKSWENCFVFFQWLKKHPKSIKKII